MNYIRITKDNIDREHICCAMSGKQSAQKKEWMKQRLEEGLVFYRSEERGKCFIEYIPAENAWLPIDAPGYLVINCLWISGISRDTALPTTCWQSASGTSPPRGGRAYASCLRRDGKGNSWLILNFWHTRALPWRIHRTAGSR